jgi:radical SAM protein with 4Fe4S-binding SPASM domain
MKEFKNDVRKFGIMELELFEKTMQEIDKHGNRRIALHKDGEPLLHPEIIKILERVKKNNNHIVYVTTNAHRLNQNIGKALLENKIDVVNFSIGAATKEFYEKVRGKNFDKVMDNILRFLELRKSSAWKPRVLVQIINLPQYKEMKSELEKFEKFWSNYDVEIQEWENLTWSVFEYKDADKKRYPCYSLWESMVVNSDGIVSACCMDWQQKLITGNAYTQTLQDIWKGKELKRFRQIHIDGKENELPACATCNYWLWQTKLHNYPI